MHNFSSDYFSYKDAAEFFGISIGTLYSMVSKNQIPHYRIGNRFVRFSKTELEAFFKRRHVPASTPMYS